MARTGQHANVLQQLSRTTISITMTHPIGLVHTRAYGYTQMLRSSHLSPMPLPRAIMPRLPTRIRSDSRASQRSHVSLLRAALPHAVLSRPSIGHPAPALVVAYDHVVMRCQCPDTAALIVQCFVPSHRHGLSRQVENMGTRTQARALAA